MRRQMLALKTRGTLTITTIIMLGLITYVLFHFTLIQTLDNGVFNWFKSNFGNPQLNFQGGLLNDYLTVVAKYGDVMTWLLVAIIIGIILLIKKSYLLGMWVILTVGSGGIAGIIMKKTLHRDRPYDHLIQDSGYSFPSGHALASTMVIVILLFLILPQVTQRILKMMIQILIVVIWLSILVSRLYFHAHYFTDVLGGVILGILWIMFGINIYRITINLKGKSRKMS
ncbi:phosphatase PAP2 family protein [Staphylococcus argenteus]|uniref:phosphatase PAP2 family protein n=2 Tax=Staphylococcus argenteus TaxID=985002 RepID=UPI00091E3BDE|nr:phosphatase PAP2 family protein [Staphylococcus argenteus]MCG9854185.1 phosphatase PAP2 family protein [Staphylococcus argenteus]MDR7650419.1 phosphatase PAP2 family protein [Staphylococcus argenteus]MDR7683480.1 phosphatase PAP2 family protein [Staphylococcus argenteus]SGW92822.1 PAP2 superfamily protein [Staphylococcus argenteus]SGX49945.1 PAP2 superfamily protein [Staphylococcus argenteus]